MLVFALLIGIPCGFYKLYLVITNQRGDKAKFKLARFAAWTYVVISIIEIAFLPLLISEGFQIPGQFLFLWCITTFRFLTHRPTRSYLYMRFRKHYLTFPQSYGKSKIEAYEQIKVEDNETDPNIKSHAYEFCANIVASVLFLFKNFTHIFSGNPDGQYLEDHREASELALGDEIPQEELDSEAIKKIKEPEERIKIKKVVEKLKQDPLLVLAFKKRLEDTGLGWAIGNSIPVIDLYYAYSRRTITPFLYSYIFRGILVLLTLDLFYNFFIQFLILIIAIPAAKYGINDARKYAKECLKQAHISKKGLADPLKVSRSFTSPKSPAVGDLINKPVKNSTTQKVERHELDDLEVTLEKLKKMREKELISEEEYQAMRKKNLGL